MTRDILRDTLEKFIAEVEPQLAEIRKHVQAFCDGNSKAADSLVEARRTTHRIKGEASMIGLADFSHIAAFQEQVIDELRDDGKRSPQTIETVWKLLVSLETFSKCLLNESKDEQLPLIDALKAYRRFRELPSSEDQEEVERLIHAKASESALLGTEEDANATSANGVDQVLLDSYQAEATDHLQVVLDCLTQDDDLQEDDLQQMRRAVHSIKGGAGTIGLNQVADLAHKIEDLFERIANEDASLLNDSRETVVLAVDALGFIIEEGELSHDMQDVLQQLENEIDRYATSSSETASDEPVAASSAPTSEALTSEAPTTEAAANEDAAKEALEAIEADQKNPVSGELLEVYVEEAEDHIKLIYNGLNALQTDAGNREELQSVRRSAHTLKGAAGAVGMRVVTKLSHRMEDLLDKLYDNNESPTKDMLSLLLRTTDQLNDISFGEFDKDAISGNIVELYNEYGTLLNGASEQAPSPQVEINYTPAAETSPSGKAEEVAEPAVQQSAAKSTEPRQMLRVPLERIDDLVRTVSELIINRTTFEQRMSNFVHGVEELSAILDRLRSTSSDMETRYSVDALGSSTILGASQSVNPNIVPNRGSHTSDERIDEFDSLEFDRYNEFHLLTRSLNEITTDVNTVTGELRTLIGDFDSLLARQDRLSRETQDRLMKVRMVPMAFLATRLHRAVRVVASKQNKDVELIIDGEDTELDKTVLEEISDPLLHLLRNAVDHGVEPSDLRVVKGKESKATIRIRAFYQGTQAVLRISDDGAGLDATRIGETAVRKGFLSQSEVDGMTPQEIYPYIFIPGLTTAKELSEVSGRGVGMDIVRDKVQKLKGTITVDSEPGKGTTFTIRLPLTLAVTRALMIVSGNELFAIPMQSVDQIARLPRETIEQLGADPVIRLNGTACPLVRLSNVLSLKETDDNAPTIPVLIVRSGDTQVAVRVEKIIAGRDIVVKTLGSHLRKVPGLIGSTLLGDGTVVPILDPVALANSNEESIPQISSTRSIATHSGQKNVMIVDDSVSVRRVMENLVKSQGWMPIVAKDGVDALEILESLDRTPDIFLLDVEMPRMDGYELLGSLRGNDQTKGIPVVMVTSRAGEKHRNKAFSLGATDYLVKPYQDEALVALINQLASSESSAT